jgi:hypothetical protein
MVSMLLAASLLAANPTTAGASIEASAEVKTKPAKPPKPSPEARLAHLDNARMELHFDLRGYGRFLEVPTAFGGSVQLGAGVRLVRGLYAVGELSVGAHAMPLGAQGQVLIGLRHELRMSQWVRPSYSLGYSHLIDVKFEGEIDPQCGCLRSHEQPGFGVSSRGEVELDQRSGIQAGLGLRFPFRWAPRLSVYLRGDVAYYFDAAPGRLQAGGGGGLQIVF